jgi:hypothetical protein
MGNFYTNVTLKQARIEAVAAEMRALNRESYVFDAGDVCVVYDRTKRRAGWSSVEIRNRSTQNSEC